MSEFGDLVSAIGEMSPSSSVRFRQGEITAVGLDTVSVDIGASGEPVDDIAFMASYSPTVGDVVWLITDGQDWFVLGQLGQDFTVESLRLRGLDNLGLTGGRLTLQGGVSRPQNVPAVAITWPNKPTGWLSNRGYNPRDWFYDSGYWYSTESLFGGRWKQYSEATETFRKTKSVSLPSDENPTGGIAVISGKAYVLVQDFNRLNGIYARWYVYRYNIATGAKEAEFQYLPSGTTAVEAYGYRPAIGVKGTNLIIGQARKSDNKIEVREYTTAGTVVGSTIVTNLAAGQPIHHISYGSYDFGAPRYVVYADTWNEIKVLSTAGVYSASESFPTPLSADDVDGLGWDSVDGSFVSTRAEVIYRHSKHTWTTAADGTWWVAHSWFDSNSNGTGQHETLISQPVSFAMKKRAALTVTTPALPAPSDPPSDDDVTGVRIYHGRGSTKPTSANMKREVVDLPDGELTVTYTDLTPVNPADTGTPPAFPGQTPFEIATADNEIVLRGDGDATLNKVVSLKDKAGGKDFINSAGTGILQGTGELSLERARLTSTTDVSLSSTGHAFQVGATSGANIAMDNNEIQARNNGAASQLALNFDGGNVVLGGSTSTVSIPGVLKDDATNTEWLNAAGTGRLQQPVILYGNRNTTTKTVNNNTLTVVGDAFDFTSVGGITRTGTQDFSVPQTGIYRVAMSIRYTSNTSGNRYANIILNGTEVRSEVFSAGNAIIQAQAEWIGELTPTDVVRFAAFQTSGSNLTLVTGSPVGWILIQKLI